MPRSSRRSASRANRRSAAEKAPTKRGSSAARRSQQRPSPDAVSPVTTPSVESSGPMADRYYAMAEEMNTRGAMELAVPFYRQAVALLLAEREALQQQLGGGKAQPVAESLPIDELHGLLEAAEALGQPPAAPSAEASSASNNVPTQAPNVETQIAELASELGKENALQVMTGLKALADAAGGQLPASGLALLGKAQMLLGKPADGVQSFEAALKAAPGDAELQINTGAARLANGDAQGALALLRGVWQQGLDALQPSSQQALLRNLSAAEAKAGYTAGALQLRLKWFQRNPEAVPMQRWLTWAQQGLKGTDKASPVRQAAMALLKSVQQAAPQERNLVQALADALEDQGDYREAALLYRQLLRPQQG